MNLRRDLDGSILCPKVNKQINPDTQNLAGCSHCEFAKRVDRTPDGRVTAVGCALVPHITICKRQRFDPESITCLIKPEIEEYQMLTGSVSETTVPEGFVIPRPVSLTQCILCTATGNSRCLPVARGLGNLKKRMEELSSPIVQGQYPPPTSKGAQQMRHILKQLNPLWMPEEDVLHPSDTDPTDLDEPQPIESGPGEGLGMERVNE